ncbi:MAG: kas 1, partial [Verrucomicrobiaceae bacterium]|nr:kas 1 [Verrucomicrobiaceae bacterium]
CVAFTNRFYQEVLDDPGLASPILFPETVFNAPASHLASYLGVSGPVTTLIGEPTIIAEALWMARSWMITGLVEQCLVIGAEEADWLSTEGVTYYDKRLVVSEGAGALLVALSGDGPKLEQLCGPFAYHSNQERGSELDRLTQAMDIGTADVLVDNTLGVPRFDKQEKEAWSRHWQGEVLSPRRLLGEGMGSSSALQLVLAAALAKSRQKKAVVSMPGYNTAAYGCVVSTGH